jgi:hypothetical protein
MTYKLKDDDQLDIFDYMAMVRGDFHQPMHGFFNIVKQGGTAGDSSAQLTDLLGGSYPRAEAEQHPKGDDQLAFKKQDDDQQQQQQDDDKRIPMNKLTRNPVLVAPTVAGMRFFGQLPGFKAATDMIHSKPIAIFASMAGGAAAGMYHMKNAKHFDDAKTLIKAVAGVLYGRKGPLIGDDENHHLYKPIEDIIKKAGMKAKDSVDPGSEDGLKKLAKVFSKGKDIGDFGGAQSLVKEAENILKRGLGGLQQVQQLASQGMSLLNNVQSLVKNIQGTSSGTNSGNISNVMNNISNLSTPFTSFGTIPMLTEVQSLMSDVQALVNNLRNNNALTPEAIQQLTLIYGNIDQFLKNSA